MQTNDTAYRAYIKALEYDFDGIEIEPKWFHQRSQWKEKIEL